jgi:hypothetical protein
MAELERSIIGSALWPGLEYARTHGTKSGKPLGRLKIVFRRDEVAVLSARGLSIRPIARELGVGMGTVRRVLQSGNGATAVSQNPVVTAE